MKGGAKVIVEPHRHEGIFVARGKEDALVTLNSTPGVAVYGEKRISVENPAATPGAAAEKVEYRVWNPFRSKRKFCFCPKVVLSGICDLKFPSQIFYIPFIILVYITMDVGAPTDVRNFYILHASCYNAFIVNFHLSSVMTAETLWNHRS